MRARRHQGAINTRLYITEQLQQHDYKLYDMVIMIIVVVVFTLQ
jgi:hypothetical protein